MESVSNTSLDGCDTPVRVLMFVHSLRRGGAERVLLEIALGLLAKGYFVEIVSWVDVDEYTEERYKSITRHYLLCKDNYRWPWCIPRSAKALRQVVDQFKPDVMELHTPTVAWVAAWANLRLPMTHVLHGYSSITRCGTAKDFMYQLFDRLAQMYIGARLVTVSQSMIAVAAAHYSIIPSKVTFVPNGIDLNKYPCRENKPNGEPVILMLGTLAVNKGQHLGIKTMRSVLALFPEARLVIVGDGIARSELEALVAEYGLSNKVEFLGRRDDVPDILAMAHILWQLSESEGLPMVVLEAMAAGVPVVGFDVRGMCDVIINDNTGCLVPYGDCHIVAAKTNELLGDRKRYQMLSNNARERVVKFFSLNSMVDGHERVLTANKDRSFKL